MSKSESRTEALNNEISEQSIYLKGYVKNAEKRVRKIGKQLEELRESLYYIHGLINTIIADNEAIEEETTKEEQ